MPARLLIVDDEELVLRSVGRLLRREPVEAVLVGCPQRALALCRESNFDVVMSDFMMPRMNGCQLLAQVRELLPAATRILLTAFAESSEVAEAVRDGRVQILMEKPFRVNALTRRLLDPTPQ